jgi:multidrug efflux pump subunit AcrB
LLSYSKSIPLIKNPCLEIKQFPNKAGCKQGETRFTPILLTTLTTFGGLLPLTLQGGTMWVPMGWTIIGGLLVSTMLTLVVVPVLYNLLTKEVVEQTV